MFPKRHFGDGNAQYHTFRNSWILIERSRPVVPCPENTPLPSRKNTKAQRSKILSVYLRPWTLVQQEGCVDVPYLADLDVLAEDWQRLQNTSKTETVLPHAAQGATRDMRRAWKQYYLSRVPAPFASQVTNFLRAVCAEGRNNEIDDEDKRATRLDSVTCSVTKDDVSRILEKASSQLLQKEATKEEKRRRRSNTSFS